MNLPAKFRFHRVVLVFCLLPRLALADPLNFVSWLVQKFATSREAVPDPARRMFTLVLGRAAASMVVVGPTDLVNLAIGSPAAQTELAAHEVYSLMKMRSALTPGLVNRLSYMSAYGNKGSFLLPEDLVRLNKLQARLTNLAGRTTSEEGKILLERLVTATRNTINIATPQVLSSINQAGTKFAQKQLEEARKNIRAEQEDTQVDAKYSVIRIQILRELLTPNLIKKLSWAKHLNTTAHLDYQESVRFMFYSAGIYELLVTTRLPESEKKLFQEATEFFFEITKGICFDGAAIKLLKSISYKNPEAMEEPEFKLVRYVFGKAMEYQAPSLFLLSCRHIVTEIYSLQAK